MPSSLPLSFLHHTHAQHYVASASIESKQASKYSTTKKSLKKVGVPTSTHGWYAAYLKERLTYIFYNESTYTYNISTYTPLGRITPGSYYLVLGL